LNVSIEIAEQVATAAREQALQIGAPMNIAVVDGGGYLKLFIRMDGAVLGSIDVALRKAKTAILFGMNTEQVFEFCKPGAPAFGLEHTNGGLAVFAGGIPLRNADGEVIGAIGVSGGIVSQDFIVAEAGAAALPKK
jgi:uncharacterized protein GlcG (DUF336 family)